MQHGSILRAGSNGSRIADAPRRLGIISLGSSLAAFFVITYLLCVLFGFVLPLETMHRLLPVLLPGFVWLTWPAFFIGLAWAVAYGWYVAVVFVPLYNFFTARTDGQRSA